MKKFLLIMASLSIAGHLLAQADFRPGFIINNTGDTLHGLVDYRVGAKNFKVCSFKREGQETVTYSPADIQGYGFSNDKRLISRMVETTDKIRETVFLEVLVKGHASLYKLVNAFYLEKDTTFLALSNEEYETYVNGHRVIIESKKYIGVLTLLLRDCDAVRAKIPRLRLTEKSMTRIVEAYNTCKGEAAIVYKAKKSWFRLQPAIYGGLEVSKVNLKGSHDIDYFNKDIKAAALPVMGLAVDVVSPRVNERISLHLEASYSWAKYEMYSIVERISSYERNYIHFELKKITVPVGFRYTFPEKKLTPFINAGVIQVFNQDTYSSRRWEDESLGVVYQNEDRAIHFKKNQFGAWAGFGLLKPITPKLSAVVEIRYFRTNGILNIVPYSGYTETTENSTDNIQITLGLRLK